MKQYAMSFALGALAMCAILLAIWGVKHNQAIYNLVVYPEAVGAMKVEVKYLIKK